MFRDTPLAFSVSEDLGIGHAIATIRATDPDQIGSLSYTLVSGDDQRFQLNVESGVLKLRDTLDRESKDEYALVVRVSDGIQFSETIVIVQVSFSGLVVIFLVYIINISIH